MQRGIEDGFVHRGAENRGGANWEAGAVGGNWGGGTVEGSTTREVMERLANFEKRWNMQSARTGIEAELRRRQAQIDPERNPGLFAQMDIASTIYSAPKAWKGPIADSVRY